MSRVNKPRAKSPRRPYKPRYAPGYMLLGTQRDKIATPAHIALNAMELGHGTEESRHALAGFLNITSVLAARMQTVTTETRTAMDAAKHALVSSDRRFLRSGSWGLSGREMVAIRLGVTLGDQLLKRANSQMLIAAIGFCLKANSKSSEVLGTVREPMGAATC